MESSGRGNQCITTMSHTRYDEAIEQRIERAYSRKTPTIDFKIPDGTLYRVDFANSIQYNVADPYKQRKMRRTEVCTLFKSANRTSKLRKRRSSHLWVRHHSPDQLSSFPKL
jgi:hypothetical protein